MRLFPAKFWHAENDRVRCVLCPHKCLLADGKTGLCLVRTCKDGSLYSRIYGQVTSYSMDPMEKKPLYHFYPGSFIFSMGTWGCNLKCEFCQNWEISQKEAPADHFEPEEAVSMALSQGARAIAFTYNEPFIWYEFVYDTAIAARKRGLKTVLVTNGFVLSAPLWEILPHVDAMNIDLKSFSDAFYRSTCRGCLDPVLSTIRESYKAGVHVELTTLIVPTLNDGDDISKVIDWVASVSTDIPLHFSAYYPAYKMTLPPTDPREVEEAVRLGRKKLKYVYSGNLAPERGGSDTKCPSCGALLIARSGYDVNVKGLKDGACANCGTFPYGRF